MMSPTVESDPFEPRRFRLGAAGRVFLALAGAAVAAASCTPRVETRCHRVCAREDECAEQEQVEFDRAECIEACIALDRDPRTQPLVDAHVTCVDEAVSCRAALACQ